MENVYAIFQGKQLIIFWFWRALVTLSLLLHLKAGRATWANEKDQRTAQLLAASVPAVVADAAVTAVAADAAVTAAVAEEGEAGSWT